MANISIVRCLTPTGLKSAVFDGYQNPEIWARSTFGIPESLSVSVDWGSRTVVVGGYGGGLAGGKGGFGSLLKKTKGGKKTTNFDAMRDLQGRRLRDAEREERLRKHLEEKRRQDELVARLKGENLPTHKKQEMEADKAKKTHVSLDQKYMSRLQDAATRQEIAVKEGLAAAAARREAETESKRPEKGPIPRKLSASSSVDTKKGGFRGTLSDPKTSAATFDDPWAILVSTSRYWYNYRHTSNTLAFYHMARGLGIPDSRIILMLAEDAACNPRNSLPGQVFHDASHRVDLYGGKDIQVDYRGEEVSIANFVRVLTGRHHPFTPRHKRFTGSKRSSVLLYVTGHSGPEFVKFQDWEEMAAQDIADALFQLHTQQRVGPLWWLTDTCKAASLHNQFYAPGVFAMSSSGEEENSYSHHQDRYLGEYVASELGVAIIDRFTYYAFELLEKVSPSSSLTLRKFYSSFEPKKLHSNVSIRTDLWVEGFGGDPLDLRVTEFLAWKEEILTVDETFLGRSKGFVPDKKERVFVPDNCMDDIYYEISKEDDDVEHTLFETLFEGIEIDKEAAIYTTLPILLTATAFLLYI